MPTHSRTSSSASSVGSSYVSSTDSNKTSHIESPTTIQSLDIPNNTNFHTSNGGSTALSSYQNAYKLINEHLHNHHNNNGHKINNEHDDLGSDNDQTDLSDLHHDSLITCNKLAPFDQTIIHETNGKTDSIYGIIKQTDEQISLTDIGCAENFAYKTLNGDVIRSVHPPGKGKAINYKVSTALLQAFFHLYFVFSILCALIFITTLLLEITNVKPFTFVYF